MPTVATAFQCLGVITLAYGLIRLDVVAAVSGVLLAQLAKSWYLDRMVLLFDEMKGRDSEYAKWSTEMRVGWAVAPLVWSPAC